MVAACPGWIDPDSISAFFQCHGFAAKLPNRRRTRPGLPPLLANFCGVKVHLHSLSPGTALVSGRGTPANGRDQEACLPTDEVQWTHLPTPSSGPNQQAAIETPPIREEPQRSPAVTAADPATVAGLPPHVRLTPSGALFMEEAPAPKPASTFTMEKARAVLRAELGDNYAREYEVFFHGSSSGQAQIDDQLPRGEVYSSATLDTAELFAHRKCGRVPGQPTMTAIVITRQDMDRIRNLKMARTKGIDDMPGKIETIFKPEALDRFGDFIRIPAG